MLINFKNKSNGGQGGGIPEAPVDGKQYARQDADWAEVQAGGEGDLVIYFQILNEKGEAIGAPLAPEQIAHNKETWPKVFEIAEAKKDYSNILFVSRPTNGNPTATTNVLFRPSQVVFLKGANPQFPNMRIMQINFDNTLYYGTYQAQSDLNTGEFGDLSDVTISLSNNMFPEDVAPRKLYIPLLDPATGEIKTPLTEEQINSNNESMETWGWRYEGSIKIVMQDPVKGEIFAQSVTAKHNPADQSTGTKSSFDTVSAFDFGEYHFRITATFNYLGAEPITNWKVEPLNAGGGITDAPNDGKQYARQDGNWTEVQAGGGEEETGTYILYLPKISNTGEIIRPLLQEYKDLNWKELRRFNYDDGNNKPAQITLRAGWLDHRPNPQYLIANVYAFTYQSPFTILYYKDAENYRYKIAFDKNTGDLSTIVPPVVGKDIDDAPSDGKTYGRKDGSWTEVTGGGSVPELKTINGESLTGTGDLLLATTAYVDELVGAANNKLELI